MTNNRQNERPGNGLDLEDDSSFGGFFDTTLSNTKPFAKVAIDGFMSSGKTTTGSAIAIGLHKRINSKKPVVFVDSERGAKFQARYFADAGIQVLRKETRSVTDLVRTMELMRRERVGDILLIDSLTHFWEAFVNAYKVEKRKTHLNVNDWGILIPQWKDLVNTPFVEDPYHLIFCGRAGYEYEFEESEVEEGQKPRKEMFKAGIKMKAGGEIGYECDLFLMMERVEDLTSKGRKRKREIRRDCVVIKDRAALIDGQTFSNPTYECFADAINVALEQPVNFIPQPKADDGQLFRSDHDRAAWLKRRDIAVEELEALMLKRWPSQTAPDKVGRGDAMYAVFGVRSWTAITSKKPEEIEDGIRRLHLYIEQQDAAVKEEIEQALKDRIVEEEKAAADLKAKEEAKAEAKANKKGAKKASADPEKEEDKPAGAAA